MIYKVKVKAPAIDDEITVTADNEMEAKERAVTNAIQRQMTSSSASATATPVTGEPSPPAPPPRAAPEKKEDKND